MKNIGDDDSILETSILLRESILDNDSRNTNCVTKREKKCVLELGVGSWELGVGSRESGVGSRESGVGSRESGVGSRESGVAARISR
jgi:hypothetical protein